MTTTVSHRWSVGGWDHETDVIRSRLLRDTGCGEAEVRTAVDRALARFVNARVREFVPLLAERDARRELRARAPCVPRGGGGRGQDNR
jgi:hypothetical protein